MHDRDELSAHTKAVGESISRAVQDYCANVGLDIQLPKNLANPVLRIEVFLEDDGNGQNQNNETKYSKRIASSILDVSSIINKRASAVSHRATSISNTLCPTSEDVLSETLSPSGSPQRKETGGLHIPHIPAVAEDLSEHQRQMQADRRNLPKRRKIDPNMFEFQPSTLDKLIIGIWEQVHGSLHLDPKAIFEQFQVPSLSNNDGNQELSTPAAIAAFQSSEYPPNRSFSQINAFCSKVTQASRVCRSIELIVQARWIELFDVQTSLRIQSTPTLSTAKNKRAVLMEACRDFNWSEKELRNKMAIWRGYKQIKDAMGWAALIFAGMGIYRFCKYRVSFDDTAIRRLRKLRKRLELAADTLHPHWRQLLTIVGESPRMQYTGHPHDWVVFEDGSDPVTLAQTYLDWDPQFAFENIDDSLIDDTAWGCDDPRWVPPKPNTLTRTDGQYICASCGEPQADDPVSNSCFCFPELFGCTRRKPAPVQIYRTSSGRNNGIIALIPFERGSAIGEFVGLVTKGVRHLDVMEGSTPVVPSYHIWQKRVGNFTRFVNHSCKANAQFSTFTWLDTQRIVLVSKGLRAGEEVFVDYGDKYWAGLDKACLCGEPCCRYKRR